jgi:uncharacterized protein YjbI with pentapeptide repeats
VTPRRRLAVIDTPDLPGELGALTDPDLRSDTSLVDVHVTGSVTVADEPTLHLAMSGCRLSNLSLTGCHLHHVRLTDVLFEECELSGTTVDDATFERVRFERCRMSGFVAPQLEGRHVSFVDCRLDDAWFRMAALVQCSFDGCDLSNADFYGADIRSSRIVRSTLDRAEVSSATFEDVALHGSSVDDLSGAASLVGVTIGSSEVVPLALSVFAAIGIVVDDDYFATDEAEG